MAQEWLHLRTQEQEQEIHFASVDDAYSPCLCFSYDLSGLQSTSVSYKNWMEFLSLQFLFFTAHGTILIH